MNTKKKFFSAFFDIVTEKFNHKISGPFNEDTLLELCHKVSEFTILEIFNTEDNRVKYAKPGENVKVLHNIILSENKT